MFCKKYQLNQPNQRGIPIYFCFNQLLDMNDQVINGAINCIKCTSLYYNLGHLTLNGGDAMGLNTFLNGPIFGPFWTGLF